MNQWRQRYYQNYNETNIMNVCDIFIQSIIWTSYYYFKGCISWNWYYPIHYAPTIKDLVTYLSSYTTTTTIQKDNQPWSPEKQLHYVLPPTSYHLFTNKKCTTRIDGTIYVLLKRYLWECPIEI